MITIKKILYLLPITILIILLSAVCFVYADVAYPNGAYILIGGAGGTYRGYNTSSSTISYTLNGTNLTIYSSDSIYEYTFSTIVDEVPTPEQIQNGSLLSVNSSVSRYYVSAVNIYVVNGTFDGTGITTQDYPYAPEPPEPDNWYDILWNQFTDWIDSIGDSLSEGYEDFINWIKGESTHGGGHEFELPDMVSPSPIPTSVPYNTVIVPKTEPNTGITYYEYNYVYNNPSGTPIITGAPPPNVDVTVNDNDFEYPYYDNPDNRNNPYYFEIPWYLKFINGNNVFELDDMGDNLTVIESAVNDETISDGVDSAYSSMGVLPTSWVQLIGIIAAIPLIGALIARFLKG